MSSQTETSSLLCQAFSTEQVSSLWIPRRVTLTTVRTLVRFSRHFKDVFFLFSEKPRSVSWRDTLNRTGVGFIPAKCLPSSRHFEGIPYHAWWDTCLTEVSTPMSCSQVVRPWLMSPPRWNVFNLELKGVVCYGNKHGYATLLFPEQFCTIKRSWGSEEICTAILFGTTMVSAVHVPDSKKSLGIFEECISSVV